jgi:molybdopterin converting factor small subunit
MPRVGFTANLQRHLSCPVQDVPGDTVGAVLDAVFATEPRLRSYILDDQGRVRRHVAIYINGERIADRERLGDAVCATDEVFVFQALSGG